ncbi:phosphatase PAP2 family protein [soil metagenome]
MAKTNAWMAAMALASVGLYVLLWVAWDMHWGWLEVVDSPALNTLHAFGVRHPGWVTGWDVFCTVLGPNAFRLIGLATAAYAMMRRRWRVVGFLFVSIGLSGPLASLAKALADRPRPSTALVVAPSSSFPSGHAVGVMVGVLALLAVQLPLTTGWQRRVALSVGAVVIVAIGVGRVVLNVHHPSDVLAGWALGYLYFYVCLHLLKPHRSSIDT